MCQGLFTEKIFLRKAPTEYFVKARHINIISNISESVQSIWKMQQKWFLNWSLYRAEEKDFWKLIAHKDCCTFQGLAHECCLSDTHKHHCFHTQSNPCSHVEQTLNSQWAQEPCTVSPRCPCHPRLKFYMAKQSSVYKLIL